MIMLGIACVVGVYFGLSYGFLVLIPLTVAAALASLAGSAVHGEAISAGLLTTLTAAISLQGGYMIGLAGRNVLSQFALRLNPLQSRRV